MAKKRKYKIRTHLRTASKVQEKQLLGNSRWLGEHPEAVVPKCEEDCARCHFSKLESKITRISQNRDDERLLTFFSKRGDQLVRAFAATVLIGKKEKAPYLAVAKGPEGDIAYMFSPKIRKEKLIGLQYFQDPHLRLLAYADFSKKKKIVLYSTKDEIWCTPLGGKAPKKFVNESISRLSLKCEDGTHCRCGHSLDEIGHIQIEWKPAGKVIELCESCLDAKKSSLSKLGERMIEPRPGESFTVRARVGLDCMVECDDCHVNEMYEFDSNSTNRYLSGITSDIELYSSAVRSILDGLQDSKERLFVVGERCYGKDVDSFVKAIAADEIEQEAIRYLLELVTGPLILTEGMTTNKLLATYWDDYGLDILKAVAHKDWTESVQLKENETPMMLIEQALAKRRAEKVEDSLPRYQRLGTYASFIDAVVRDYKSLGRDAAMKRLDLAGTEDTRTKSIGLAFIIALGGSGKAWQYTNEEREFARHLSKIAKQLLESSGDEYDKRFRELIQNAGVTEEISRIM